MSAKTSQGLRLLPAVFSLALGRAPAGCARVKNLSGM